MKSRSVLIFGAGGFVGQYLAREFKEHGYAVYGSDVHGENSNLDFEYYFAVDITDTGSVKQAVNDFQPGIVVNLAAISSVGQSWKMPQATMQVNVGGTLNVLEAAKDMSEQPKVLLIGSSEEYSPSDSPLKETDSINSSNPYGISKVAQERFAELYEQRFGLKIYRTRSFNHTGVGQQPTFVLPSWCKQVAEIEYSGVSGALRVGNIDVKRDFSDVRDVVRAYRLLVESDFSGEVFNIGSGRACSLRDLAYHIASLSSQDVSVEVDADLLRPNDNPFICCDRSKIYEKLGWEPEYTIENCLNEIYSAYLKTC